MGIAVIIPNVNFEDSNIGKVTLKKGGHIRSISIVGPDVVFTPSVFSISFLPANTEERSVIWSIVSGNNYATIDPFSGVFTPLEGADGGSYVIRAVSSADGSIFAEKTVYAYYGFPYSEKTALVGDGIARIETLYIPKRDSRINYDYKIDYLPDGATTSYFSIFGAYTGESYPVVRHLLIVTSSSGTKQQISFGPNNATSAISGLRALSTYLPTIGLRYKQSLWLQNFTSDPEGNRFSVSRYGDYHIPLRPIAIFSGGVTVATPATRMTLYSFEIEEGGNLVMDLVPCSLTSNIPGSLSWDGNAHAVGENGLWDKVGNKFYGNCVETGGFTIIE